MTRRRRLPGARKQRQEREDRLRKLDWRARPRYLLSGYDDPQTPILHAWSSPTTALTAELQCRARRTAKVEVASTLSGEPRRLSGRPRN